METDNPYRSTYYPVRAAERNLQPSNGAMWRAYLWSPSAAPIAFVAIVFLAGVVSELLGIEVNPASMLVLPAVALTVGMVSCYLVAGVIGMPIAFYLRHINALNVYSIHGAALCWAVLFTVGCALAMFGGNWSELPVLLGYFGIGVIPPVLLSGTAFWLLLRRYARFESGAAL